MQKTYLSISRWMKLDEERKEEVPYGGKSRPFSFSIFYYYKWPMINSSLIQREED
jgi:hypothetical protein